MARFVLSFIFECFTQQPLKFYFLLFAAAHAVLVVVVGCSFLAKTCKPSAVRARATVKAGVAATSRHEFELVYLLFLYFLLFFAVVVVLLLLVVVAAD